MTNAALIVAAGRGGRMMRETPKQYLPLGAKTVIWHTISAFLAAPEISGVLVVIHPDDRALYNAAVQGIGDPQLYPAVHGGTSRAQSVRFGLEALADRSPEYVLIHDAARPFCPPDLITDVITKLAHVDGAFAALPVVDALWRVTDSYADTPQAREGLWRAQTPQAFRYNAILKAHSALTDDVADDVEVARQAGLAVQVVEGREDNFKITLPSDLERAERLLA